jgi:N-acetylmuramoyl-L-alanine amidase
MNPPEPVTPANSSKSAHPSSGRYSIWKGLQTIILTAIITATLLTLWTPANIFSNQMLNRMFKAVQVDPGSQAAYPTPSPAPRPKIGIVAGHWGNDPGARCPDGLSEVDVNLRIAELVRQNLMNEGFDVDLLQEFDKRLSQYQALALISIHNDSCNFINNEATGFKVVSAASNLHPEKAARLTACLVSRYLAATGLKFHYGSITEDMTGYHAFKEINNITTAAIIETGFLNLDRQILTEEPARVAQGVSNGILCFIRNESVETTLPTQKP